MSSYVDYGALAILIVGIGLVLFFRFVIVRPRRRD